MTIIGSIHEVAFNSFIYFPYRYFNINGRLDAENLIVSIIVSIAVWVKYFG
jgi:hypothetical protein